MQARQSRTDPVVLLARTGLLAATTVVLGVAGHLAVGGTAGPGSVLLLLALAVVVGLRALRGPAGTGRILALLVGGQGVVHVVLGVLGAHGSHSAATAGAAPGALALPVDGGRRLGSLQDSHDVATGHADLAHVGTTEVVHVVGGQAPLLLAHLLVAVALGLALALGERCLWTLIALLAAGLVRLLRPLLLVLTRPAAAGRVLRRTVPVRPLLLLDRSLGRRGPPLALAAR